MAFTLECKDRYAVPTDPLWDGGLRAKDPGPGHYDPYPFLNPATHRMRSAQNYPDRECQDSFAGRSLYAQQPMFLSLPQKERNKFWARHRDMLDNRKIKKMEKVFLDWKDTIAPPPIINGQLATSGSGSTSAGGPGKMRKGSGTSSALTLAAAEKLGSGNIAPGNAMARQQQRKFAYQDNNIATEVMNNSMPGVGRPTQVEQMTRTLPGSFFEAVENTGRKDGDFLLQKAAADLVFTNRDLPITAFARVPANLGNKPLLKRVAQEPCHEIYDTNTSTLSFAERRALQRKFRLTHGLSKIQRKVLESRKTVASIASLARDTAKNKQASKVVEPAWYIPPLPKEEGLGDMLANKSLRNYKVVARARALEPNSPNQKDCIATRWTGIGSRDA
ncbi:unnamed protein product [Amoebophrya sp. A25]|nr:unnamed protein product [Amoebophrya sp. A25]|eukprot:GSA25T00021135001.1